MLKRFELTTKLTGDDFNSKTKEGRLGQSHWLCELTTKHGSHSVEYHQGAAYRVTRGGADVPQYPHFGNYDAVYSWVHRVSGSRPKKPNKKDVLFALYMDANCVHNGESFEDFCSELGYDTDSRSAYKAYEGCRDADYALKRLGFDYDELSVYFEDK